MIPKILHLFWNCSPMSLLQVYTVTTFHKLHPDWRIILYVNNEDLGTKYIQDYVGVDYFFAVRTLPYVEVQEIDWKDYNLNYSISSIQKSDIFRYIKLYEYGGMWCDFDVFWLQRIDRLYEIVGDFDFTTCKFESRKVRFTSIGILLTKPKTTYYKELIDKCFKVLNSKTELRHQTFGTIIWDQLYPIFDTLKKKYPMVVNIPYEVFYPYKVRRNALTQLFDLVDTTPIQNPNVIAVHWFNGHPITKKWINDGMRKECSMSHIINNNQV